MRKHQSRVISLLMALFVTVTTLFGNVNLAWAAETTEKVLASWTLSSVPGTMDNETVFTQDGEADLAKESSFTVVDSGAITYSAATSKNAAKINMVNKEKKGVVIQFDITNLNGCDAVSYSSVLRSSGTGMGLTKVEYKFDNDENWVTLDSDVEVKDSYNPISFMIPNCSGKESLSIKLSSKDSKSVKGNPIGSTGNTNIGSIVIKGLYGEVDTTPTCAAPTASVAAGQVESGTSVSLSTTTSGATIYYDVDGSNNYVPYTEAIVIDKATTISCYAKKDGYNDSAKKTFAYTIKVVEEKDDTDTDDKKEDNANVGTEATTIEAGDVFVLYHPASKVLLGTEADGSRLKGVEATPENGKVTIPKGAAELRAVENEDGSLSFVCDGKYLTTGETGSSLSFATTESQYSTWKVENKDNNLCIASVNAKYNGTSVQYIEYYKTFTTYSYKSSNANDFALVPYVIRKGVFEYKTDNTIVQNIAEWGCSANYDEAGVADRIYADLLNANDLGDKLAWFHVVLNGKSGEPYYSNSSTQTGSTSYFMGAKGLGATSKDYFEIVTSSRGLDNMNLAISLCASSTGSGAFQGQYSTDGETFYKLSKGKYSYSTTVYNEGVGTPVSKDGDITDGIAKTSLLPAGFIDFDFEIPAEAANAEKLYIRFVADDEKNAKGDKAPATSGTLRIRTLKLTGSPIVDKKVSGYVSSNLTSGGVSLGSKLELSSKTEGASIFYSVNGGEYKEYTSALTLNTLPTVIRAYSAKEGLSDGAVMKYAFEQEKCENALISPNGGAILKAKKVKITTTTKDAKILYAFVDNKDSEVADSQWKEYTGEFTIPSFPQTVKAKVVKEGAITSAISVATFTEKSNDAYNIYFGQIHAHTNFSDGAGDCEEAFDYATKVDNLDYIAITDHSNSLDGADSSAIDQGQADPKYEWNKGHALAEKYSSATFTCLYGYEMTWSNGLGHMNTFNTPGFQSRTQKDYSTYGTALQNYYAALNKVTDSISMFNHPGTTFGDFSDFAYYSEANDALINLIEVGNGEGVIGSSGYFPSYEYYTRALDKGWHVAPTNNQDNHKGKWGDANTARTVVLADANNAESIYDAMRNRRIYATEDNNLSIYYTLDGNVMGTILDEGEAGENVVIKVELSDASKEALGKVEVIVNGGLSIASKTLTSSKETVTFNVPANYSYYYIKVTEKDGDIAVTAPVWIGEVEACGINGSNTSATLPIQGEELDVNVDLYNNEKAPLIIDSVEVELDGKVIVSKTGEEAGVASVSPNSEAHMKFLYTYKGVGAAEYKITVNATLNGVKKVYKDVLKLNYAAPQMVSNVIIDGTHYNDYVAGYYGGNVNNFIAMCGAKNVKAVVEKNKITEEMLKDCALLVISAPAKKNGTANAGDYVVSHFEDEFLAMVARYVQNGGNVVVCGMADYQDSKDGQTKTEMDKLLTAIGSTIRMNSDEVYDEVNNGGQPYRLYPTNFNKGNVFLAGVKEGQQYSQYSGCSVDITNAVETDLVKVAEALVTGFDTTYSIDCKTDAGASSNSATYVEKGNVVFIAHQETKAGGNIFVAGGVFLSDFEVKAEMDNADSLPYINYTIAQNIIDSIQVELPVTNIADVRKAKLGEIFAVEGYVTNGTFNEATTFFDSIYIQDATGGIDIFPYAEAGLKIGTKIRVVGYVDEYQGDRELQVLSATILDAPAVEVKPLVLNTKDAMNYDLFGGRLLQTSGIVTRVEYTSDGKGVSEFWIMDETGREASIFIDGYIYSATTGKNELAAFVKKGAKVSAVGVLYKHPEGDSDVSVPVFRVRNCDEIVLLAAAPSVSTPDKNENTGIDAIIPAKPVEGDNNQNGFTNTNVGDKNNNNSNSTSGNTTEDVTEEVTNPVEDVKDDKPEQDDKKDETKEEVKDSDKSESKEEKDSDEEKSNVLVIVIVVVGAILVIGIGSVLFVRKRGKNA